MQERSKQNNQVHAKQDFSVYVNKFMTIMIIIIADIYKALFLSKAHSALQIYTSTIHNTQTRDDQAGVNRGLLQTAPRSERPSSSTR